MTPVRGTNTLEGLDRIDRAANQAEVASLAGASARRCRRPSLVAIREPRRFAPSSCLHGRSDRASAP